MDCFAALAMTVNDFAGWYYVPVLARKPGALRNGAPFKDWVLPAAMERIRCKLAGADDGPRQIVDILAAVITDGLPAVEAACAEAIAQGVHSADVILNILARQRTPGPSATIQTPAALTLRHAPVADCANGCACCRTRSPAPTGRPTIATTSRFLQAEFSLTQVLDWPLHGRLFFEQVGHLGIAEDARPFPQGEIGGDDDRGALIEAADEVEQQLPPDWVQKAGSRVRQGQRSPCG
jgi:hypothetical protein